MVRWNLSRRKVWFRWMALTLALAWPLATDRAKRYWYVWRAPNDASVDNAMLSTLLFCLGAALTVNGLALVAEWAYLRIKTRASTGQFLAFITTLVLTALATWAVHGWIARGQPVRSDPRFDEPDGGWELWAEYMTAYWRSNNWRVAVITLVVFNIGVWLALNWPGIANRNSLLRHRSAIVWSVTGMLFIAALLLAPHNGWSPWWDEHSRPWWQPQAWFPHRYLSSTWWPITLIVLTATHLGTRLLLKRHQDMEQGQARSRRDH